MVWNIFKVNNKDARTTSLASIRHRSDTPFMENSTKQNKIGSVINHLQFIITKILSDKLIYVASDVRITARDLVKRLIFNTYWSFNTYMSKCYLKTLFNRSPLIMTVLNIPTVFYKCRGLYRTQWNIYDGAFSESSYRLKRVKYFPEKAPP